jgi:hypothetical protein
VFTVQVPREIGLTVLLEIEQTFGVEVEIETTNPELAVALMLCVAPFTVVLLNCEKVIDCD